MEGVDSTCGADAGFTIHVHKDGGEILGEVRLEMILKRARLTRLPGGVACEAGPLRVMVPHEVLEQVMEHLARVVKTTR